MFVDNEALIIAAAAPFDLEAVRPGPGQAIQMAVINDKVIDGETYTGPIGALDMALTHAATAVAGTALITVAVKAGEEAYFTLPANTLQFITVTALPANAVLAVRMEGGQTNL